jgi:hypothetical protein
MAIFVSYSRQNEKAVKALARGFEAARRQVWLDADLGGGDAWWDKILYNIRSCSVFIFALSDASLSSKPCREELDYAIALRRPVMPVQVGTVGNMRANPLSTLQIVNFRMDDANSGFELLAAVDAAVRSASPLPDPLPAEPIFPSAYLLALGRQIDTAELDQADQIAVVDQLRKALGEETEDSVRQDVLAMLRNLMGKPWTTRRTERDIRAVLIANAPTIEAPTEASPTVPPSSPRQKPPRAEPERIDQPRPSEPDGRAIFERRMAELRARQEADERRQADQRAWEQPASGGTTWGGASASTSGSTSGTWGGVSVPAPQTHPEPAPQPQPQPPAYHQQPFVAAAHTSGLPVSPPNYWALSIIAVVLSLLFGGIFGWIAMYFSYQVGERYDAHDYDGAVKASRNAKTWAIVGLVVGGLGYLSLAAAQS